MNAYLPPRRTISSAIFVALVGLSVGVLFLIQFSQARRGRKFVQPVISEIQAMNVDGLKDEEGHPADWIELWNPTKEAVSLAGWSLTDDFRRLHKWTFPEVILAPDDFIVVFATGKNRTNALMPLHTNFRLNPQGEYLALVAPRGDRVVQEFLPKYPKQIANTTFGLNPEVFTRTERLSRIDPVDLAFLLTPSPGAVNTDELLGVVEDTRFSHERGLCMNAFHLAITTKTFGAEIRYTLDGSAPAAGQGFVYTKPISIKGTTTVRAAAFRPGFKPGNVDTHTFVFADDVLHQAGAQQPATWGIRGDRPVPADYEMDPEIVTSARSKEWLVEGLASLPSVSLVLSPESLFGEQTGIYSNPMEHGGTWERPGSFEWMPGDGRSDVQVNCGVRVQGGWSRRPEESPKHSFRLLFRKEYGSSEFKHRLFGKSGPKTFRELILRAGCNNSWLHWNGAERRRGDLLRDQWMRDTLSGLGTPSPRGTFVHLYLNGLYWGIYNLVERPDADYLARLFGGSPGDYDSRNGDNVLSGDTEAWDQLFALANAGVTSSAAYAQMSELLDLPSFIDFMIVHLYGGSGDIDRASNWYAARLRRSGGRYVFIMWDGERSLEDVGANALGLDDDQCPTRLFQKLRKNPQFRAAFSRRVQELTAEGGPLSPERAAGRYRELAAQVGGAMICESARWGDYRRDVHPYKEGPYELYTVEAHWKPEVKRLLEVYFPNRTAAFLNQLQEAGLLVD